MKIIGWTNYDNEDYKDKMFESYEERVNVLNLVSEELRKKGYKWSGDYHQHGNGGCPVFDDNTKLAVSLRLWGRIMADAYPEDVYDSDDMGYCEWAWIAPEEESHPEVIFS